MQGGWKRFNLWMALFGNGYVASPSPSGSSLAMENNSLFLLEDGSSHISLEA